MNISKYADVLRNTTRAPYDEGTYISDTTGNPGYWATYQVELDWYWFSVSNTTRKFGPSEVAEAISKGTVTRQSRYKPNSFEATVKHDGHSYMLGMGMTRPRGR
jgi:hypothetical protein